MKILRGVTRVAVTGIAVSLLACQPVNPPPPSQTSQPPAPFVTESLELTRTPVGGQSATSVVEKWSNGNITQDGRPTQETNFGFHKEAGFYFGGPSSFGAAEFKVCHTQHDWGWPNFGLFTWCTAVFARWAYGNVILQTWDSPRAFYGEYGRFDIWLEWTEPVGAGRWYYGPSYYVAPGAVATFPYNNGYFAGSEGSWKLCQRFHLPFTDGCSRSYTLRVDVFVHPNGVGYGRAYTNFPFG